MIADPKAYCQLRWNVRGPRGRSVEVAVVSVVVGLVGIVGMVLTPSDLARSHLTQWLALRPYPGNGAGASPQPSSCPS